MNDIQIAASVDWLLYRVDGRYWEAFEAVRSREALGGSRHIARIATSVTSGRPSRIVSRGLPLEWADATVCEYFEGNLEARPPVDTVEASLVPDLPESRFWSLIAVLGGDAGARALRRLRNELAVLSDPEVIGFARTLQRILHDMDSPDLVQASLIRGERVVSEDATMAMRSRILMAGVDAVAQAIDDPVAAVARFKPGALRGENLAGVAAEVIAERRGVLYTTLDTGIDFGVGGNADRWPARVDTRAPSTTRSWREWLTQKQTELDLSARYGAGPALVARAEDLRDWVSVRYVLRSEKALEERIDVLSFPIPHDDLDARVDFSYREHFPAQLVEYAEAQAAAESARLLCSESMIVDPRGSLFTIQRRSSESAPRYRRRYRIGPEYLGESA